jgi:hypothetical protein
MCDVFIVGVVFVESGCNLRVEVGVLGGPGDPVDLESELIMGFMGPVLRETFRPFTEVRESEKSAESGE